ncbi:MAG: RNA polymerase sigma factor [Acidimicrobiales bacterium]
MEEDGAGRDRAPAGHRVAGAGDGALTGAGDRALTGVGDGALTDAGLVVAIARGRAGALSEAYRRHSSAVYRLASRLCGAALAEDVAQDVFLALWRAPQAFDPGRGPLRSYLLVQARGRAVDLWRSETARRAREAATRTAPTEGHDVEAEMLARQAADRVWALLSHLPEPNRQAILLAWFGEHTYRQVAALLHRPEGTVKSHIRSGLAQLRAEMADEGHVSASGT